MFYFSYPFSQVFPLLEKKRRFIFDGKRIYCNDRIRRFVINGTRNCNQCGLQGEYFVISQNNISRKKGRWNLHLYGVKNGKKIMLTIDHIIPLSRGGSGKAENLQLMCFECNQKKADQWPLTDLKKQN